MHVRFKLFAQRGNQAFRQKDTPGKALADVSYAS